jgi:Tfp pilus assembly protein PilO
VLSLKTLTVAKLPWPVMKEIMPLGLVMTAALSMTVSIWVGWRASAETLLAEHEGAFQAAKQNYARLQTTRTQQERMKAARGKVESEKQRLPTQSEFSALSISISELGQQEHVTIPGMTYTVQKNDKGLPVKATMTFKATGDYTSIYKFIQRLEQTEAYLVIESLDAARIDHTTAAAALVEFNMKVVTFLRRIEEDSHT